MSKVVGPWAHTFLVLGVGTAIRMALWMTNTIPNGFEFSQPPRSFEIVSEALTLHSHGLSPYVSSLVLQPPLILLPFMLPSWLSMEGLSMIWGGLILLLVDASTALALAAFAIKHTSFRLASSNFAAVVALFFLNPISILSCAASSLAGIQHCLLTVLLLTASEGMLVASSFLLAFSVYSYLPNICFVVPVAILLARARIYTLPLRTVVLHIILTAIFMGQLLGLSYIMLGSDLQPLKQIYTNSYNFTDMTPNWGLYWYFFSEMFDDFRSFWVSTFQIHMVVYAMPLVARVHRLPTAGSFIFSVYVIFSVLLSSHPTLSDMSYYVTLAFISHHKFFVGVDYGFAMAGFIAVMLFLGPTFYYSWTTSGTGNSNFFYGVTLIFNLTEILFLVQYTVQGLKYIQDVDKKDTQKKKQ